MPFSSASIRESHAPFGPGNVAGFDEEESEHNYAWLSDSLELMKLCK